MAPIKFENNIKEKLEQRRLKASADAWEKLQSKLGSNESNKNKRSFWWLGIAASIFGVLIAVSIFSNDPETATESIIVDVKNVDSSNEIKMVDQSNDTSINEKKENLSSEANANQPILRKQQPKKQSGFLANEAEKVLAQVDSNSDQNLRKNDTVLTKTLTFEELKVQEVLAQINTLKQDNKHVTDAEINALLDRAENEIKLQNLYDASINTVNAEALLQGVEADLEQSFRDRIFEAIKSGYKEVKTAVVERNN